MYYTELANNISTRSNIKDKQVFRVINHIIQSGNRPEFITPDKNELFDILKYAIKYNNIIGCCSPPVNKVNTDRFGVYELHQYNVSDVFFANGTRYVKCHNPHNQPDRIKKYELIILIVEPCLNNPCDLVLRVIKSLKVN